MTLAQFGGLLGAGAFLLGTAWGFFCGWLVHSRALRSAVGGE